MGSSYFFYVIDNISCKKRETCNFFFSYHETKNRPEYTVQIKNRKFWVSLLLLGVLLSILMIVIHFDKKKITPGFIAREKNIPPVVLTACGHSRDGVFFFFLAPIGTICSFYLTTMRELISLLWN